MLVSAADDHLTPAQCERLFILFPACCTHAHHMSYIQIGACEFGTLNLMMVVVMSVFAHPECL